MIEIGAWISKGLRLAFVALFCRRIAGRSFQCGARFDDAISHQYFGRRCAVSEPRHRAQSARVCFSSERHATEPALPSLQQSHRSDLLVSVRLKTASARCLSLARMEAARFLVMRSVTPYTGASHWRRDLCLRSATAHPSLFCVWSSLRAVLPVRHPVQSCCGI